MVQSPMCLAWCAFDCMGYYSLTMGNYCFVIRMLYGNYKMSSFYNMHKAICSHCGEPSPFGSLRLIIFVSLEDLNTNNFNTPNVKINWIELIYNLLPLNFYKMMAPFEYGRYIRRYIIHIAKKEINGVVCIFLIALVEIK